MSLSFGALAVIAGAAVAIVGLGLYQAWWTVVFPIGGAVVAMLERRGVRAVDALISGGAIAAALASGGVGAFLVVMSGRSCARPDLPCPDGPPELLLAGLGALVASAVFFGAIVAFMRRRQVERSNARDAGSRDIYRR